MSARAHSTAARAWICVVGKSATSTSLGPTKSSISVHSRGASIDQPIDDVDVGPFGVGGDDASDEFVVDHIVDNRTVRFVGHDHVETMTAKPVSVEVLFHRVTGSEKADLGDPLGLNTLAVVPPGPSANAFVYQAFVLDGTLQTHSPSRPIVLLVSPEQSGRISARRVRHATSDGERIRRAVWPCRWRRTSRPDPSRRRRGTPS